MSEPVEPNAPACESFPLGAGRSMEVRPTHGGDAERLLALYNGLAREDRRKRFFTAWTPHEGWCREWATIGDRGGFGVIAIVHEEDHDERVVGEAGYAMRSDGDGDLAVTVAHDSRGWLGAYLVERLVEHAAQHGVENLQADVLLENTPMMRILRHRGSVVLEHSNGTEHLTIATTGDVPSWPPDDDRTRLLVEVAGGRWRGERAADKAGFATAYCAGPAWRNRHGCSVLNGARCPLADGADAIVVLLDPEEPATTQLIEAHLAQNPSTPLVVRSASVTGEACDFMSAEVSADVADLLDSLE